LSGGTFCFDTPLVDKGPCHMPVDPQDSRPVDPRPPPSSPGNGGTVSGSSYLRAEINNTKYLVHIGLGDVVKDVTIALGFRPCAGCERRAERLNHLISFRLSRKNK